MYEARQSISKECLEAAGKPYFLYRLTVPTGGGKTLGSLRFALHHARTFHRKRIIYIAPYNSILEQNAEDIRKALGGADIVLEHHCNVIQENGEDEEKYALLTENWESPVICTTAVQFLNTLFASGVGNIRRMYSICNSVILFDEIQALPVKLIELFNQAINYLTVFGRSTVVLCSATQPILDRIPRNRLCPPKDMVMKQLTAQNEAVFKRTTLIDRTGLVPSGLSVENLCDFVEKVFLEERQVLIIVNTKGCAQSVFEKLKERVKGGCLIVHLSTNMCVENRQEVMKKIRTALFEKKDIICVSTQLFEAGVNLSFRSVIHSLAGLDLMIRLARRQKIYFKRCTSIMTGTIRRRRRERKAAMPVL